MSSKSYYVVLYIVEKAKQLTQGHSVGTYVFNMVFLVAYHVSSASRSHCTNANTDIYTVSVFPSVTIIDSLLSSSANHTDSVCYLQSIDFSCPSYYCIAIHM